MDVLVPEICWREAMNFDSVVFGKDVICIFSREQIQILNKNEKLLGYFEIFPTTDLLRIFSNGKKISILKKERRRLCDRRLSRIDV